MPTKITIPAGAKFGRLTVLREDEHRTKDGKVAWICQCECGTEKSVTSDSLRTGKTVSCGCYARSLLTARNTIHGQSRSPEYTSWQGMHDRCERTTSTIYRYYGGRGIKVCPEWSTFERFYSDMGPKPSPKHSIDRIDANGPYSPENCRWATVIEQKRNTRRNRFLTHAGMTLTLAEWSERTGIGYMTLRQRLRIGWTLERAITEPVNPLAGRFVAKDTVD